jgi:putative hydrolase of the HAD superfamily
MPQIKAAFFDFGGVILSSPFEAFATYEQSNGLPEGFIRGLNATNPDTNAWAQLERNHVPFDEFCRLYEGEATAAGHDIDAREVIALLSGTIRPEMVEAVRRCKERLKTACLTNNIVSFDEFPKEATANGRDDVLAMFDVIVESSKVGVRKPETRFYEIACEQCGVEPVEAVFLDDLGINLKPAKAMGMTTIKVVDPADALAELEAAVGFPVR